MPLRLALSINCGRSAIEGRSALTANDRNYFGIKCFDANPGPIANGCHSYSTSECTPTCYPTSASFRTYASITDSFRDHGRFLTTNSRYRPAFGNTKDAATARKYWQAQVMLNGDAYYQDVRLASDPNLIRPFRVSMSCGFCHIAFHAQNPPADPERPEWANLSSTIGNQFWRPSKAFANLTHENNALFQFLNSQQPGTIDTSLVSTDQINNSNTITNIWEVPARLARATLNPPEDQSDWNLRIPSVQGAQKDNPRITPRVLLDGADSVGVFGALSRVYANIGTYPEEWFRDHNAIIGFKPQRPFNVQDMIDWSVFWNTGDEYRIPYLYAFFKHKSAAQQVPITTSMKLAYAPGGAEVIAREAPLATEGRKVFIQNCAICHSSKQPQGFGLQFNKDWRKTGAPTQMTSALSASCLGVNMSAVSF